MKQRPREVSPLDHLLSNGIRITVGCGLRYLEKLELQFFRGVARVQRWAHMWHKISKLLFLNWSRWFSLRR